MSDLGSFFEGLPFNMGWMTGGEDPFLFLLCRGVRCVRGGGVLSCHGESARKKARTQHGRKMERRKETPTYSRNGRGAWKLGYRVFVFVFCTGNGEFHSLLFGNGEQTTVFLHLGSESFFLLGRRGFGITMGGYILCPRPRTLFKRNKNKKIRIFSGF